MTNPKLIEQLTKIESRIGNLDQQLSEEQADFVLHPLDEPCYLNACPGSGKTEVVGIKAAYEIANWKDNFSGIAVLSFTKNAAKEISDRVKKYGGENAIKHPHFIGTIDSWLHGYILQPFGHKVIGFEGTVNGKKFNIINDDEKLNFLHSFKTKISGAPSYREVWVNEYYYECADVPTLQTNKINLNNLSKSIYKELKSNKVKFLKSGLCTYGDAEFLCFLCLNKYSHTATLIAKRFPVIIIDECQDLSCNQLGVLKLLHQYGVSIHFAGDNNQSIYEFKRVFVTKINAFTKDCNLIEKPLTKNFRSVQPIVDACQKLAALVSEGTTNSVCGEQELITANNCILWEYQGEEEFLTLPQKFIDYIQQINAELDVKERKLDIDNCGILARGHSTLSKFRSRTDSKLKTVELIANALRCWGNNPRTGKDMQNALEQLGKAICVLFYMGKGNPQNQYCPDSYTFVEWRKVLVDMIIKANQIESNLFPFADRTWSQWIGNLKTFLKIQTNDLESSSEWDKVKSKIKSPSRLAKKLVSDRFKENTNIYSKKVRMTTFHDIKGESLDAALVVSANRRGKGGHIEEWMSTDKEEYTRFAYVASSRPRQLLIWAVPVLEPTIRKQVIDLGFKQCLF